MILDLERLRAARLCRDPFDFVIVDDFVQGEDLPALLADFPMVRRHGSFAAARRSARLPQSSKARSCGARSRGNLRSIWPDARR